MGSPLSGARTAVAFLTRIPVRGSSPIAGGPGSTAPWFPVIGAAIGAVVGLVRWTAGWLLPEAVAAVLAVAAGLLITGALHEDGLADTFDGMGAGGRDEALAAMRDSRLGTFGGSALVVALASRAALLAALGGPDAVVAAAVAGGASRGMAVSLPPSLRESATGLGTWLLAGMTPSDRLITAGLSLVVAAGAGLAGLAGLGVAAAASLALLRWSATRLGGPTGDVLGAVQVISEMALLVVIVAAPGLRPW